MLDWVKTKTITQIILKNLPNKEIKFACGMAVNDMTAKFAQRKMQPATNVERRDIFRLFVAVLNLHIACWSTWGLEWFRNKVSVDNCSLDIS